MKIKLSKLGINVERTKIILAGCGTIDHRRRRLLCGTIGLSASLYRTLSG